MSTNSSFFNGKEVLVTGGAGFIGSHLVERLLQLGSSVLVIDNFSKGTLENLEGVARNLKVPFMEIRRDAKGLKKAYALGDQCSVVGEDLTDIAAVEPFFRGKDIVLHIAASISGRYYQELNPSWFSANFAMNHNVISLAQKHGVDRVHYASSACVYPMAYQYDYDSSKLLKEGDEIKTSENGGIWVGPDGIYGYSKYSGEQILKAYHDQFGLKGSISRYITAYGPRENDTHAIMALIRKAVEHRDPFMIHGTGNQDRDFGYVDDIVEGTLLATEKATNAEAFNFGTGVRWKISSAALMIRDIVGFSPMKVVYDKSKPEGPKSRALDITKAKEVLGWEPKVQLNDGLKRTIDWFKATNPKPIDPDLMKEAQVQVVA